MAEAIKISTGKYIKQGKVEVDGMIWDIVIPGAGTELRFSQASRMLKLYGARLDNLNRKFDKVAEDESGNTQMSEEDLDLFEEYSEKYRENEKIMFDIVAGTFKDGTPDNSEVKKWMQEIPSPIIFKAFDDLKNQTTQLKEVNDGEREPEPTASS